MNVINRDSFDTLIILLREKFSFQTSKNKQNKIINVFHNLKQNKKRLQKYFAKTKWFKKNVFSKLKSFIVKRLIDELNDNMIRRIVEFNFKKKNKTLKKVIKIIEKTTNIKKLKNHHFRLFNRFRKYTLKQTNFSKKNKMFFKFLKNQTKIIQQFATIQFDTMKKMLKMMKNWKIYSNDYDHNQNQKIIFE